MPASLATMRTNVLYKVANKPGITANVDAKINEAVLHIVTKYRPQDMWGRANVTAVANQALYTFNVSASGLRTLAAGDVLDLYAILMVRNTTNDREILRGSMRHFNRLRQDTAVAATVGEPRRWTRQENSLVLYSRIPDSTARTFRVTYLRRPPTMVVGPPAQLFPLNDEWQAPVEEYAAFLLWTDLNEANKAAAKLAAFQTMIGAIVGLEKPEVIEDEAPEAAVRPFVDSGE